jgi:hypothetical protein
MVAVVRNLEKEADLWIKQRADWRGPRRESLAERAKNAKAPNEAARLAAQLKRRRKKKAEGKRP